MEIQDLKPGDLVFVDDQWKVTFHCGLFDVGDPWRDEGTVAPFNQVFLVTEGRRESLGWTFPQGFLVSMLCMETLEPRFVCLRCDADLSGAGMSKL